MVGAAHIEPARAGDADRSDNALDLALEVTGGYPSFLQEHGYAAFTVPHLDKFTRRAIPELMMPPERRRASRLTD